MSALSRILKTLATPSVGTPYTRGVIFMAHAMCGASIVSAAGWYGIAPALIVCGAYAVFKERDDIKHGGSPWDSLEDSAAVLMGGLYGFPGWPVAVLLTGFGVMVAAEARR